MRGNAVIDLDIERMERKGYGLERMKRESMRTEWVNSEEWIVERITDGYSSV